LGCIHYRLHKFHAAHLYFSKALKENENIAQETSVLVNNQDKKVLKNIYSFSKDKKGELLYNSGLQLLLTGNNIELAFECFKEAALSMYNNPRLWLRMAECVAAAHVKRLEEDLKKNKSDVVAVVAGKGNTRRIKLPVNGGPPKGLPLISQSEVDNTRLDLSFDLSDDNSANEEGSTPENKFLKWKSETSSICSLGYGFRCTKNVLYLLSRTRQTPNIITNTPTQPAGTSTTNTSSSSTPKVSSSNISSAEQSTLQTTSNNNTSDNSSNVNTAGLQSGSSLNPPAGSNWAPIANNNKETAWNGSIYEDERNELRQAALALQAYIGLSCHNPVEALSTSLELLSIKECSSRNRFLANVYAAEALCLLNRPKDAIRHLAPAALSAETPIQQQSQPSIGTTIGSVPPSQVITPTTQMAVPLTSNPPLVNTLPVGISTTPPILSPTSISPQSSPLSSPTIQTVPNILSNATTSTSVTSLSSASTSTPATSSSTGIGFYNHHHQQHITMLMNPNQHLQPTIYPSPYAALGQTNPFSLAARCTLYVNMANVHILKNDFNHAQQCLNQALLLCPNSSAALILQVYLELRKGNTTTAIELLKSRRTRFKEERVNVPVSTSPSPVPTATVTVPAVQPPPILASRLQQIVQQPKKFG